MGNVFYSPGSDRAELVKELFARIARRYDLINDLQSFGLHRYWKQYLIQLSSPEPDKEVLDICCGTGDLGLAFARRRASVIGLDFSEEMLGVAAQRKSRRHGAMLNLVRADGERLPFADQTFDIVSMGYGLRNLTHWETGLEEMCRVTKPGGRVLVLDFGKPENAIWRSLYFGYLRCFVPWLGRIFCGEANAYSYILESLRHYPAQRGVAEKMRQMKLTDVRIINFLGGVMSINYARRSQ
jgi:demethylmenaquinone methyltransferase/2-methoxy-6-polyprenyl-1,4-benzoquinol methylase